MKTTDEIIDNIGVFTSNVSGLNTYTKENVKLAMLEYGKQVLQLAAEKAETKINYIHESEDVYQCDIVNKDSILNLINELK